MDETGVFEQDPDMRDADPRGVEEDEVSRTTVGQRNLITDLGLLMRLSWERRPRDSEDVCNKPGAIDPLPCDTTEEIRSSDPGLGLADHLESLAVKSGRSECVLDRP